MRLFVLFMITVLFFFSGIASSESQVSLSGTYRLISFETRYENGDIEYPFGKKAVGQISYDTAGNMSAIVMKSDCPTFISGERLKGTDAEVRATFEGFIGYFGTFTVDTAKGTVTHHVRGASFPNWVGGDQVRHFKIEGAWLTLSMPPKLSGGRRSENIIVWERIK
jgi:hypothetical protein